MVSLQISISDRLKAVIDGRISRGEFKDASEYLAALVHADAQACAHDRLEALLLEGIDSAELPWDSATRDQIRRDAQPLS